MKLRSNNTTVTMSIIRKILMVACIASLLVGSGSASTYAAATASQTAIAEVNLNYRTDNVQEGNSFRVYLNDENVTERFENNPIQVTTEGRTLLPLRTLGELLDSQIDWDAVNKVAIVTTTDGKTIEVPIGATDMIVNGSKNKIDNEGTQAIILSSRTYLPFRAIAEACGATVDYKVGSDGSKNIYLTTSESTMTQGPVVGDYTVDNPLDPVMANAGFYTYIEMGYDANNGPDPSDPYYDTWYHFVKGSRDVGLTDEQINSNLQYIYGYDSTTSANTQYATITNLKGNFHSIPTWKGEYKYQMYYAWTWDGFNWCPDVETYCGIGHVGLTLRD